jgi:peptide-methionine (S)-S-oxide reductase
MKKLTFLTLLLFATVVMARTEEAIFAGGNFWYLEADFNAIDGILETVTGFDGGHSKNPSYEDVAKGKTDYVYAIRVIYNPDKISYSKLLAYFWRHIDPTVKNGQFCEKGAQYRSAIFYLNEKQKMMAIASKHEIEKKFKVVFTTISPSTQFNAADYEQQEFYQKHPIRYQYYLYRCGTDSRLQELWNKNAI